MKKNNKVIGLIPCRLNSSRLPKKALLNIDGLPLIVHTFKRALLSKKLDRVIVCTDSKEIQKTVENYGGEAVITKKTAQGFSKLGIEIDPRLINLYFKFMIAPFSKESTRAPEDEAIIVLPAVPIEASRAY